MSVLIPTTVVTVTRGGSEGEIDYPGAAPTSSGPTVVAKGLPANIGAVRGRVVNGTGQVSTTSARGRFDPVDLRPGDYVTTAEGAEYRVLPDVVHLPLIEHVEASLEYVRRVS